MKYEFHPEALAEYDEAAHYCEECQDGLQFRFIAAIEHAIGLIRESPQRGRILDRMFGGVLPECFLTQFFTRSSLTSF